MLKPSLSGYRRGLHRGFTLIELIIVIAIIAIVADITIPSLLRQRENKNESLAIEGIRRIVDAQALFQSFDIDGDGTADAGSLEELEEYALIDVLLGLGEKSGYHFDLYLPEDLTSGTGWTATATPLSPGRTGNRTFSGDETGRIRVCEPGYTPVVHPRTGAVRCVKAVEPNSLTPRRIGTAAVEALHLFDSAALASAKSLTAESAFISDVLAQLAGDTELTFDEQLDATAIRAAAAALSRTPWFAGRPSPLTAIGDDEDLAEVIATFVQDMQDAIQLAASETDLPALQISEVHGAPDVYLELVPESRLFASLDILRYLIEKLDPDPRAGQMTALRQRENEEHQKTMIEWVDETIEHARHHLNQDAIGTLTNLNFVVDGRGTDWIGGDAAVDIQAMVARIIGDLQRENTVRVLPQQPRTQ